MKKILLWASIALMVFMVGCATHLSLSGHWTYRDPTNQVSEIDITSLSKDEFYFNGYKNLLSGVYKKHDDMLTMARPDNPHAAGFIIRIVNANKLLVVEEPPTSLTGQKHISGELTR